ncbi:hypothetical protein SGPA1_31151 [Streptomyces misionensis JCM 4497]
MAFCGAVTGDSSLVATALGGRGRYGPAPRVPRRRGLYR